MTKCAFALAAAFVVAAALLPTVTWAGPDKHNKLAAPFAPNATIYRPECWLKEEPTYFCNTGSGLLKDEE